MDADGNPKVVNSNLTAPSTGAARHNLKASFVFCLLFENYDIRLSRRLGFLSIVDCDSVTTAARSSSTVSGATSQIGTFLAPPAVLPSSIPARHPFLSTARSFTHEDIMFISKTSRRET